MRQRLFAVGAFLLVLAGDSSGLWAEQRGAHRSLLLQAPAGTRPVRINPAGETVLPNGRLITPLGKQVKVAPHPYGLALSPDGRTLVTANSGTAPFSFSILTGLASREPQVVQIPPRSGSPDAEPDSVFLGVAIAPDNRTLYLSEGNNGRVGIFDLITRQRLGSLSLDGLFQGKTYSNSLSGELKLSPDGRRLVVLDLAHFRLVIFEVPSQQILSSLPVGRMPFGLALSPDGQRAYVSNVGMFQYTLVPGYDPKDARHTGLDFPAFGFPSQEAEKGTTVNGKQIPGLGDPNVPESNSLWVIDIRDAAQPQRDSQDQDGNSCGKGICRWQQPGRGGGGPQKGFRQQRQPGQHHHH